MSNFITNSQEKTLSKRLNTLIEFSKKLNFLVGFFYFSGIKEIYESLKNKENQQYFEINILVGLDIDIFNKKIIEIANKYQSDHEAQISFVNSVKNLINSNEYDNKDNIEKLKFFINLLNKNILNIRKTREPNHAKLYLFEISEEYKRLTENLFIVGSSNLTKSGLESQSEFNVEIKDYGYEDAKEYFDTLWKNSIEITTQDFKQKLVKTIEEETHIRKVEPYEAFVLALKTYIDTYDYNKSDYFYIKRILENTNYKVYNYQLDAIKQGLSIIEKNNGVIIADVVGLGKSIIASCIAKLLNKKGGIIIAPPGLLGNTDCSSGWRKYIKDFGLDNWDTHSSGDLENTFRYVRNYDDIVEVVIVDEAHRFRNSKTKSYETLKNICRNKIVILLSATPFNNKPSDILSLLTLFTLPKKSNLTISENLEIEFNYYQKAIDKINYISKHYNTSDDTKKQKISRYCNNLFDSSEKVSIKDLEQKTKEISREIKKIIEPITIRRNRLDIEKNPLYSKEAGNLSKLKDPIEVFFELEKEQSDFYDEVLEKFENEFKGAVYQPFLYDYEGDIEDLNEEENFEYMQQISLFSLIKRLLVRRFESSFGAFKNTLIRFKDITQKILNFVEKSGKYILDKKLIEDLYNLEVEEIEENLIKYSEELEKANKSKYHKIYEINKMLKGQDFINDIKKDLELFENILKKIDELKLVEKDPKLNSLINEIEKNLKKEKNRKIVVFSEYLDTIKYLKEPLLKKFNNRVLVIERSINSQDIIKINENFDALFTEQKNDYDILIGTDRISEGFNLNRAGIVINYDIPWNPVRVIQRVGRINRISKKVFDELYILNFFPTIRGENIIKSREIASKKIFMIHSILGEDSKILSIDEKPEPSLLYDRLKKNPDELEKESFYTRMMSLYLKIKENNPDLINKINKFPQKIKVSKNYNKNELITLVRKAHLYIYHCDYENNNKITIKSFEDVFDSIYCEENTKNIVLSEKFWDNYKKIENYKYNFRNNINENNLSKKALNVLRTIIRKNFNEMSEYKNFIKNLEEDINNLGSLSYNTLKTISNINCNRPEEIKEKLKELKNILGDNYIEKLKNQNKNFEKEIIISIENIKE